MASKLGAAIESTAEAAQGGSWVLFRILTAAMFMTHGYPKLFGENPQPFQGGGMTTFSIADVISLPVPLEINLLFIAGMIELIGGGMILIGLFTRFFSLLATLTMLMAYLTAHLAWFPTLNRGELAAFYCIAFLIITTFGSGPLSVDALRASRREKKQMDKMEHMMKSK